MAKQAQSSSQLRAPQVMIRPTWPEVETDGAHPGGDPLDQGHGVAAGPPDDGHGELQGPGDHRVERALVDEEGPDAQRDDKGADEHGHEVQGGTHLGRHAQPEDGDERQAHDRSDQRPGERPHGQCVVGAEATEPAEAVDRRHRVADGQRVGDGLRRERHLDQGRPRCAQVPRLEELELHGRKAQIRPDLGHHRRPHPPPVERPEDGAEAVEFRAPGGEHPHRGPHQAEADDDARRRPCRAEYPAPATAGGRRRGRRRWRR